MSPTVSLDVVYEKAVEKAEEGVTFYQEDEVQKYIRENPHELSSLASTVSLGDASTTAATANAGAVPPAPSAVNNSPIGRARRFLVDSLSATVLFADDDCRPSSASSSSSSSSPSSSTSALARLMQLVVDAVWGRTPPAALTWALLLPLKHAVLRAISVLMYAADALGVEAALTERTAATIHDCVDRIFALPTRASAAVGAVPRLALRAVWWGLSLWWAVTVWWVTLPYHMAVFVFAAMRTVCVTLLVVFLNRAPGGHRILKALNGHIAPH